MTRFIKIGFIATLMLFVFIGCGSTDNKGGEFSSTEYRGAVNIDSFDNRIFILLDPFAEDAEGFQDLSAKIYITDEKNREITNSFSLVEGKRYILTVTGKNPIEHIFIYENQEYLELPLLKNYKPEGKITSDILAKILLTEGVYGEETKDFNITLQKGKYKIILYNYGLFDLGVDKKHLYNIDEEVISTIIKHRGGKISIKVTSDLPTLGDYYLKIDKVEDEICPKSGCKEEIELP